MGIRGHKAHALQAATHQIPQELGPEGLTLASSNGHSQDLTIAVIVEAVGHHDGIGDHQVILPDFHVLGVEPEIRVSLCQGAVSEGIHLLVEGLANAADLALRDPLNPERLYEILDLAGADTLYVRLLNNVQQGLLRATTRLQEAR